jgi:hypothetical protein
VAHFDSKAHIEEYIRKLGIPATFFMPGFYMSNLPGGMFRKSPPNNDWTLALPIPGSTPVPLLDTADDTGKFVKGILNNRKKTLGKQIYGATDYYTLDEMVKEFKELYPEAGKTAKTVELPHQVFKDIMGKTGVPAESAEELLQNMRLMNEFGYVSHTLPLILQLHGSQIGAGLSKHVSGEFPGSPAPKTFIRSPY